MNLRNITALLLIIASLICLYPGLMQAMMTLKVATELPFIGKLDLYEATQSIIQTIENLFIERNYFVAWLILLFSIVVPIVKAILLLLVILATKVPYRNQLFQLVSVIGKWSMADVFVVSVFMAFLVTQSNDAVTANLHSGFYYFTAYCILSILGTQLIDLKSLNQTKDGSAQPASSNPA